MVEEWCRLSKKEYVCGSHMVKATPSAPPVTDSKLKTLDFQSTSDFYKEELGFRKWQLMPHLIDWMHFSALFT